jgi:hypothetical protein
MAAPVLQFKRGLLANLPGLRAGEPGFTTDSYDLYVGIDSTLATNKFFGSHRYWKKETASAGSGINLVEANTGSDFITLAAPASVGAAVTYYFPATQGSASSVLTNDGSGNLSWASGSSNAVFTGITTFSDTTDNTLGNENTGAVQLDGGMGIAKNLTVKQNLHVGGYSEFVGIVTFRGGTINLGDDTGDNINIGGEFTSGLYPNTTATYDLGDSTRQWRHLSFSGVGTFATGAVVDAVRIGITATNEIDTSSGNLILDSTAGTVDIQDQLTVSGIATVNNNLNVAGVTTSQHLLVTGVTTATGSFTANGAVTLGDAAGDIITVNGTATFGQTITGTISTATRANLVATNTAPSGTFYPGLFVSNTGVGSTAVYVDAGISYVTNTDTLTLTGDIAVNGGDVTTSATTFNLVNDTATNVNFAGAATALVMGAATGISTIRNNLTVGGDVRINGSDIQASDGNTNITLTSNTLTAFAGDIRVNGNDIQASDGNANISLTSNTLTTFAGDIRVNGNDIQASDGNANITLTSNTLTAFAGDIRVNGNDIQSSTGANVITMSTNNATFANDVTVTGNLYVNGSTTQVNTTTLNVKDALVDLGLIDTGGGVLGVPTSDLNKDIGLLFNYFTASAKKAAVYWDDSTSRIVFADDVTESTGVLTPATGGYAAVEMEELWINSSCTTNTSTRVIGCTGSTLILENITIDGGAF